jgi:hypothetical protein
MRSREVLYDIRYFESAGRVDEGAYHHYTDKLYQVPNKARGRANRLATLCFQRGVAIGRSALYLCFTPALPENLIVCTDFREEVWLRYVMYGLPLKFNDLNEDARIDRIWLATLTTLRTIAPEHVAAIDQSAREVEEGGEDLEILVRAKSTKKYEIRVFGTMPTHPAKAQVYLVAKEVATGRVGRCKLVSLDDPYSLWQVISTISLVNGMIVVRPSNSIRGGAFWGKRLNVSAFAVGIDELFSRKRPAVLRKPWGSRRR